MHIWRFQYKSGKNRQDNVIGRQIYKKLITVKDLMNYAKIYL